MRSEGMVIINLAIPTTVATVDLERVPLIAGHRLPPSGI